MVKISFSDFERIMSRKVIVKQTCIEIEFCVDNSPVYHDSWLGKMANDENSSVSYWFGLTADGSQAYDYDSFEQFVNARVFNDNSLCDIWDSISLLSIDACDVQERLSYYLYS